MIEQKIQKLIEEAQTVNLRTKKAEDLINYLIDLGFESWFSTGSGKAGDGYRKALQEISRTRPKLKEELLTSPDSAWEELTDWVYHFDDDYPNGTKNQFKNFYKKTVSFKNEVKYLQKLINKGY